MNKLFASVLSGVLLSHTTLAEEPAVYTDGVLSISSGAVIDEFGVAFYRDIQLVDFGFGYFRIVAAEPADLATVEMVTVIVDAQAEMAEVVVEGTKPTPCVEVAEPAMRRFDDTLIVALPLTEEPDSDVCVQVKDPFEYRFPLDLSEVEPGTYTVIVNGVADTFVWGS